MESITFSRDKLVELFGAMQAAYCCNWCECINERNVMPQPERVYQIAVDNLPASADERRTRLAVLIYIRRHAPWFAK
jgi:hypothetical protein